MKSRIWPMIVAPAVALSIGWGIRGNFGHEHGAMMPGALAAMAAVLVAGRADWHRRVAYFGAFGALGWAFGGSMSYGHVLGYANSIDSPTVAYGYACLFLIGFLWAAVGGAATALSAYLSRERLTELFAPVLLFFGVLALHDLTYEPLNVWLANALHGASITASYTFRQDEPLYWFDADWTTALIGVLVPLAYAAWRRRFDRATSLMLHLSVGWWAGFLLFPVLLGWRMTPPRGDNWAGCLGLTAGLWVYLWRENLRGVLFASLLAGFVGGAGFALATLFQALEVTTAWPTNWHSVLEQTYGLINGIGIGAVMLVLRSRAPRVSDEPAVRRWTDWFAPAAVFILVSYLNLRKNPEEWVKSKAMAPVLAGLQPITWFNLAYLALAIATVWLLVTHLRRGLPLVPTTWLGKGQALLLAFLWCVVVGNFERALPSFAAQRLITEGVIFANAVILTLLILLAPVATPPEPEEPASWSRHLRRTNAWGIAGAIACVLVSWSLTRAFSTDETVKFRGNHIRFGPHATATTEKPRPGAPHP